MKNDPFAGQPSWRGADLSGESQRPLGPRWRSQPQGRALARRGRWPWGRIFVTLAFFAAVCGLFVWVSLWLRPAKDTSLVVLAAGYQENLAVPHNVHGWNGALALAQHAKGQNSHSWDAGVVRLAREPREVKSALDLGLQEIGGMRGKTLLLYVSLHGGADRKGAYLLPDQAFMDEGADDTLEQDKVRLEKIIDKVQDLAHDRGVVLVLDATHMAENWALGMLNNEFARELDRLNDRIAKVPNLVVVSASGVDQRSWSSDEWRQTAFGHFFLEGIKGAADHDKRDGRIDLLELFRYVSRNVNAWATLHRGAEQTPMLYPLDEVGRDRARKMHLTVAGNYTPPAPEPYQALAAPELIGAWKRHNELLAQTPRPAVYTPYLWRLHQDWLLRYEQLVYAKGSAATNALQRLRDLEQAMLQAQRQELTSERNTLAMLAATGRLPRPGEPAVRAVNDLWEASSKDQVKVWQDIQAKTDVPNLQLRLHVMELLYERAMEDPGTHLDKAYQLMTLIDDSLLDDPLKVRPAEAHFLMMLRRDVPGLDAAPALTNGNGKGVPVRLVSQNSDRGASISSDLMRLALRVRLRAERAVLGLPDGSLQANLYGPAMRYPYVEQVAPWIGSVVEWGDQSRRRGQDLLFAGDQASWAQAEKLLLEADQHYQKAQRTALWVRRALGTRDTILPMLPYYAHWLAQRQMTDPERRLNQPALAPEKLEKVCQDMHGLLDLLARPGAEQAKEAADTADRVARQIEEMEAGARSLRQSLDQESQADVWKELDAALTVPFANIELRQALLERKRRVGLSFQSLATSKSQEQKKEAPQETAQARARKHGRMNLALLGQRWFDECGGDLETCEKVRRRLEVFAVEAKWWESLTIAGDEIGLRWQRLPREIGRALDAAAKSSPEEAGPELRRADRLQRFLDGPGPSLMGKNATGRLRLRNLENLMLVQGRRAWQDHWYADDPAKEPYFRRAGLGFLRDAETLARLGSSAADGRLGELARKIADPAELRLELVAAPGMTGGDRGGKPIQVNITTEESFGLKYRLVAPSKDEFTGVPLLWVESGPGLQVERPKAAGRLPQEFGERPEIPLEFQLTSPYLRETESRPPLTPVPLETNLTLRGYYRGQLLARATPIWLHPLPLTQVSDHLLPVRAGVAVRASKEVHQQFGQGSGGLVLILDCSGSMGPAAKQPFTKSTKFAEATEALRGMLQKVPKGTQVSLWVFGQAVGEQRTVEKAEETIQPLIAATTWDPADPMLLKSVMDRISYPAIIPWNESPILRTMSMARQDLQGVTGFKTMVVLTDGMDNRFDKDAEINPGKKDSRSFLRENFPDIEVNVIGFKVVSQEEDKARKQFQVIEELPLPGRFYLVHETKELAGTLEKVLRQRLRYWVDREDNRPVAGVGEIGLDIGTDSASDQWLPGGLPPGAFKVRVHTNKRLTRGIALNQSDMLLLDLVPGRASGAAPGLVDFERVIYSQADFPWKPAKDAGNWRMAVLQNQLLRTASAPRGESGAETSGLQMLATLERKNDPLAVTIQQVVPLKTWLEVAPPADVKVPLHQRWHYQPGYPAPAWSLDVPLWPARTADKSPVRPTVRMWWSLEEPLAGAVLERGHDFNQLADLAGKTLRVGDNDVVVESVHVEDRLVETEPAGRDQPSQRERKPCLVVRLRHAPASPVWVRAPGLDTAGSEHRFYSDIGKYTGVFWPVSRDQAGLSLRKLEIVSLAAFKRDAEQRKLFVELDNLYEPQANDARPLPPQDLTRRENRGNPRPLDDRRLPMEAAPPALLPLPKSIPERPMVPGTK